MTAKLTNGREVAIVDRHYITRHDGETILASVTASDGRRVAAADVAYIF